MSMRAIKVGGSQVHWDLEDIRRCSDHVRRQSRKTAATIKSLKRLIHRAERLQGKIACLIGE